MSDKTYTLNSKPHVKHMRRALSCSYKLANTICSDSSVPLVESKKRTLQGGDSVMQDLIKRGEGGGGTHEMDKYSSIIKFVSVAASDDSDRGIEEMISGMVSDPAVLKELVPGMVYETTGAGTTYTTNQEIGLFKQYPPGKAYEAPCLEFPIYDGKRKVSTMKIRPRTLLFHSRLFLVDKDKYCRAYYDKYEKMLSMHNSYFLFYFTKSLVTYMRDYNKPDSSVMPGAVDARNKFIEYYREWDNDKRVLAEPAFISPLSSVVERVAANAETIASTLSLFTGLNFDKKTVTDGITDLEGVLKGFADVAQGNGKIGDVVDKMTGLAAGVVSLNSGNLGSSNETGNIDDMIL